jgi:hypothetical protein
VLWFRRLAALSPRRTRFGPGSVQVGFVVDKVAVGLIYPSSSVYLCQYHSTVIPYSYIALGINNGPAGGRSSETQSHSIDINKNTPWFWWAFSSTDMNFDHPATLTKIKVCIHFLLLKWSKAVPLHAMETLGGRGATAPIHSWPQH